LIEGTFKLANSEKLSGDLATRINRLIKDRQLREKFGRADRKRRRTFQLDEDRGKNKGALRNALL